MNFYKNNYLFRFGLYVQKSVDQAAFIPVNQILDRFLKALKKNISERQKDRYKSFLQENADRFKLSFKLVTSKHGKILVVTSSKQSHFNEQHSKYDDICYKIVNELKKSSKPQLSVYELLKKICNQSRATQERIVQVLKEKAKKLKLEIFLIKRKLHVKLIRNDDHFSLKNTPHRDDILGFDTPHRDDMYIEAKDLEKAKDKLKHPQGELREIFSKKIKPKAFSLMRELKRLFYDNVKVKICEPMLFKFSEWALIEGFDDRRIHQVFEAALLQRHADATDMGLNQGNPKLKFEMSSTVSLAKELLVKKDPVSCFERWNRLKLAWKNGLKKKEKYTESRTFQVSSFWTRKSEEENDVDIEQDEFIILRNHNYSESQIKIFQHFLNNTLPQEIEDREARIIANIGVFLAERFSEESRYKIFRSNSRHKILQAQGLSLQEKEKTVLLEKGYDERAISIFQSFQRKELSFQLEMQEKQMINAIGVLLSEKFPEEKEYERFHLNYVKHPNLAEMLFDNECPEKQRELFQSLKSGIIPNEIDDRDRKIIFAMGVLLADMYPNDIIYARFRNSDTYINETPLEPIELMILALKGYQDEHIQLFNNFKKQGMDVSYTVNNLKTLASMGVILAENYPNEPSYQKFNFLKNN